MSASAEPIPHRPDVPLRIRELAIEVLLRLRQHGPCRVGELHGHLPDAETDQVAQALRLLQDLHQVGMHGYQTPICWCRTSPVSPETLLPLLLQQLPARSQHFRILALEAALDAGLTLTRAPSGLALCLPSGERYAEAPRLLLLGLALLGGEAPDDTDVPAPPGRAG